MSTRRIAFRSLGASCLSLLVVLLIGSSEAYAVPAFAVQTGQPCSACHAGGFGPQLTPLGRQFKLEGYTMRGSPDFTLPVSGMAVASYVHTSADQAAPPAPHYSANDNLTLDQANLFIAGGLGDHFGSFAQFTYDGVGRAFAWDNLDLRATDNAELFGQDVLLGLTLNNSPGVQDPWNTMSAWGFPYTDSNLSPAPGAGTVIGGSLAQSVIGVDAYAWWNSEIYTELGLYWTPGRGFLRAMGVDIYQAGVLASAAPYVRLAYEKQYDGQNFNVGIFAFFPELYPGGDRSTGTSDRYTDMGIDASYQFMGSGENIFQINTIYTHESQNLKASALLGNSQRSNSLNDFRADVSYYWRNTIGGTIGVFDTWGSADSILYSSNTALKPDSSGLLFQLDATPFGNAPSSLGPRFNVRVGIQYRVFTKFDGATSNYDGLGHNASDNNTLRVFTWFAF
jgi:hypothetical protein